MSRASLAVTLVLALAVPLQVMAASATQRLMTFLKEVRSLEGSFEQTVFDESFRRIEASRGKMYLQRPGHFRWNYSEPYRQEIVADGEKVWIYDSDLAQVTVRTLDTTIGNTPALLLSSDIRLAEHFTIKELGGYDALEWVELTPKTDESTFTSVKLGFGPESLESMELEDNFAQTTKLRFFDMTRNPVLDPDLFSFSPPEGVDVFGDNEP